MENTPSNEPEVTNEQARTAIATAVADEGGPTKENMVLAAFGYATRQVDIFQGVCINSGGKMLPLTDSQVQALVALCVDCSLMGAKMASKMAGDGLNMIEWAAITEEEANSILLAQMDAMFMNPRTLVKEEEVPTEQPTAVAASASSGEAVPEP